MIEISKTDGMELYGMLIHLTSSLDSTTRDGKNLLEAVSQKIQLLKEKVLE